jgi:hypothetical protein
MRDKFYYKFGDHIVGIHHCLECDLGDFILECASDYPYDPKHDLRNVE